MLTKDDLLVQDTVPNIKDISLELYKDFSLDVLCNREFHYYFNDGSEMAVEFREWGIYHMLAIQHINGQIGKNHFFEKINQGLKLSDFSATKSLANRYKSQKERIAMFACTYHTLRSGMAFYLPSRFVKNTGSVEADYIIFNTVGSKGMNIGIRKVGNIYVPMTVLISKAINQRKYLDESEYKLVRQLTITDKNGNTLDTAGYALTV